VTACGTGASPAPAGGSAAPVELTYMNFSATNPSAPAGQNSARIAKVYTDRHPNVTIADNSAGFQSSNETFAKIASLYAAGTPPDVFWLQASRLAGFWPKGLLVDLTPLAAKDPKGAGKDDTDPVLWSQSELQGKLMGLPIIPSTAVHFYNADAYRQLGLKTPAEASDSGNWTWDQYKEAAIKLTNRTPGQTYRVAHRSMSTDDLAMLTWANGGETLNKEQTRLLYDTPAALDAMDYIYDFVTRRQLTVQGDDLAKMGASADEQKANILWAFPNGKVTNAMQGSDFTNGLRQAVMEAKLNWGIAPVPAGKGGRFTRLESQFMVIAAPAKHPDAAWSFLTHLGSAESDAMRIDDLTYEPVRKSNAKRFTDLKVPGLPQGWKYVVDSRKFAHPWIPRIPEWGDIGTIIGTNFTAAINGQLSTKDATLKMTTEANNLLPSKR
jgi:multiple sugar transport system substrate-binding protein